jgi:hypothetical protein
LADRTSRKYAKDIERCISELRVHERLPAEYGAADPNTPKFAAELDRLRLDETRHLKMLAALEQEMMDAAGQDNSSVIPLPDHSLTGGKDA